MEAFLSFVIAFAFSFIGMIPPGTINLSIIQLGITGRRSVAWRLALAAALVEYPYAWLAVEFENLITSSTHFTQNFQIVAGAVMIALGVLNLRTTQNQSSFATRFQASGFRRGVFLALLNLQALPYWLAITAYIKSIGWLDLSTGIEVHAYLIGVSLGTLSLLIALAYLSEAVVKYFKQNTILKKIPGYTLILLGMYSIVVYVILG